MSEKNIFIEQLNGRVSDVHARARVLNQVPQFLQTINT